LFVHSSELYAYFFVSHFLFFLFFPAHFFHSCSFVEAILYSVAYPDYGPCSSYSTKLSCEEEVSPYDTRMNICLWDTYAQDCSFIEPELNFYTTLIISVLGSLCTVPFVFLILQVFKIAIFPAVPGSEREQAILAFYEQQGDSNENMLEGGGDANEKMLEVGVSIKDPIVVSIVDDSNPGDKRSSSFKSRFLKKRSDLRLLKVEFASQVKDEIERTQDAVWAQYGELQKEVDDLKAAAESSGDSSSSSSQLIAAAEERVKRFSISWFIKQKKDGMLAWIQWAILTDHIHHNTLQTKTDDEKKKLIALRIHHDMELAKEIMEKLAELPTDMKERRLMEYARAMELRSVEKVRVFFFFLFSFFFSTISPLSFFTLTLSFIRLSLPSFLHRKSTWTTV
jgi:cell division septum initiation protein DivIVA